MPWKICHRHYIHYLYYLMNIVAYKCFFLHTHIYIAIITIYILLIWYIIVYHIDTLQQIARFVRVHGTVMHLWQYEWDEEARVWFKVEVYVTFRYEFTHWGMNNMAEIIDIFKCNFSPDNLCILTQISLRYITKRPVSTLALIQVAARCRARKAKPILMNVIVSTWCHNAFRSSNVYVLASTFRCWWTLRTPWMREYNRSLLNPMIAPCSIIVTEVLSDTIE